LPAILGMAKSCISVKNWPSLEFILNFKSFMLLIYFRELFLKCIIPLDCVAVVNVLQGEDEVTCATAELVNVELAPELAAK
jgi:hypothetical protein